MNFLRAINKSCILTLLFYCLTSLKNNMKFQTRASLADYFESIGGIYTLYALSNISFSCFLQSSGSRHESARMHQYIEPK
jgi:hypothetical protein